MAKYLRISLYIRKPFLIYDFATDPILISLYMRKISFSFLSVYARANPWCTLYISVTAGSTTASEARFAAFVLYCICTRVKEWKSASIHTWVNVSQGDVFSSMQYKPEATNALNGTASG
jgi:hypothetical protein